MWVSGLTRQFVTSKLYKLLRMFLRKKRNCCPSKLIPKDLNSEVGNNLLGIINYEIEVSSTVPVGYSFL